MTLFPGTLVAQLPTQMTVEQTLRMQQAIGRANGLLKNSQSAEAIAVLEQQLPNIHGNPTFLELLHTAYTTHLAELQANNGDPGRIAELQSLLKLDGAAPTPVGERIPPAPLTGPEPTPLAAPEPFMPTAAEPVASVGDPFQQAPLEAADAPIPSRAAPQPVVTDRKLIDVALGHFADQNYTEAARHFQQAHTQQLPLNEQERHAWAYCRLHGVVASLKQPNVAHDQLEQEVGQALSLAPQSKVLRDFAEKRIMPEIERRKQSNPSATVNAIPSGWKTIETSNFRILYQDQPEIAEEAGRMAEMSRHATFEKWSGPTGRWTPRCDLYLHENATAFAVATKKPTNVPGVARVTQRGATVLSRRLDLRLDDPNCLALTLPHQLTYLVLTDLFGEQTPPRWAAEAMAVLAEPPTQVARYLRSVGRCQQNATYIQLAALMQMNEFPPAEAVTPFYVQSVSLVDYLVSLKGARAFTLFMVEAPRYGMEKSLQRQYGIPNVQELEQRWLRHAVGNNTP